MPSNRCKGANPNRRQTLVERIPSKRIFLQCKKCLGFNKISCLQIELWPSWDPFPPKDGWHLVQSTYSWGKFLRYWMIRRMTYSAYCLDIPEMVSYGLPTEFDSRGVHAMQRGHRTPRIPPIRSHSRKFADLSLVKESCISRCFPARNRRHLCKLWKVRGNTFLKRAHTSQGSRTTPQIFRLQNAPCCSWSRSQTKGNLQRLVWCPEFEFAWSLVC